MCFGVFRVFKGDQGGKLAKIQAGVKPDIFKITALCLYSPPSAGPPPSGRDRPKFRAFFPSPATIFLGPPGFGYAHIWPNRIWAKPHLAKKNPNLARSFS